jgi:SpoVK/Ycf46/Vps4 family AAA+-type ATPase
MAAARQLLELVRSHVENDDVRFRTAVLQLAASEARQGHQEVADQLTRLGTQQRNPKPGVQEVHSVPFARPEGELAGILEVVQPAGGLNGLVLPEALRTRLDRVVKEQRIFNRLREHGLQPRRRVLLLGPPGCGKTMTAHAIAHDLGLPLYVVRLDALFTKYLGETASKLRLVFDAVERQRAVFLFDEFDSLGLARGSQHDVAEMRRVLNSFLVFIDQMRGHSLILAASNHADSLDPALFRRFDDVLHYNLPTPAELQTAFRHRLAGQPGAEVLDWKKLASAAKGLSLADAIRSADDAVKMRLVEERETVQQEDLLAALAERAASQPGTSGQKAVPRILKPGGGTKPSK